MSPSIVLAALSRVVCGCGRVVVLVNHRDRWLHDVRDRSRGRRRMLCRGICHDLLPQRSGHTVRYSITPSGQGRAPGLAGQPAHPPGTGQAAAQLTGGAR
jgi:hypothetical protein